MVGAAERLLAVAVRRQPRRGRSPRDGRAIATWRWSGPQPAKGARPADAAGGARAGRTAVRPRAQRPELRHPADHLRPRPRGRARHAHGAGRAAISLRARFGELEGRVRPAAHDLDLRRSPASRRRWPARTARSPHGSPGRPHGRRIVRAAIEVPGPLPPARSRCASRGRANDVVAGTGAGRHVRRVGARRYGRGARQARRARVGPACSGSGRARAVRDDLRGRSAPGRRGVPRMARAEQPSPRSCASPSCPSAGTRFRKAQTIPQPATQADARRDRHAPPATASRCASSRSRTASAARLVRLGRSRTGACAPQ